MMESSILVYMVGNVPIGKFNLRLSEAGTEGTKGTELLNTFKDL